jgi:ribosomal-protein-alanine N-acetyltransferase
MKIDITIHSESIFLRSLQPDDATLVYLGWLSDPSINLHLEVRFSPPQSVNELQLFIADANMSAHTLMLGIFLKKDHRHIGNIKLGPVDWNHMTGELGFLIGDKTQWGKGYTSKAISLLAEYAFTQLGLAKLTAGLYVENEGSRRALLNAGFREEGRRIGQWLSFGHRQDGILMGLVNPSIATNNGY